MTPKSLLRHPAVVSDLDALTSGVFERILPDERDKPAKTSRVLLCSGKIYYELAKHREESGRDDVAILRLEQLYPLADKHIEQALEPYADGTPTYWVQEEPANMGAWFYMCCRFGDRVLGRLPLKRVSRNASASPATGSAAAHQIEQQELIEEAFAGLD